MVTCAPFFGHWGNYVFDFGFVKLINDFQGSVVSNAPAPLLFKLTADLAGLTAYFKVNLPWFLGNLERHSAGLKHNRGALTLLSERIHLRLCLDYVPE